MVPSPVKLVNFHLRMAHSSFFEAKTYKPFNFQREFACPFFFTISYRR